jgi:chemotaxis protein MotB
MSRRRHHEEHANHEAWAIPFGDLLTLLLAFFVVMYAISSVNEGKYRVVSEALNAAFHGTPHSPQAIPVGEAQGPGTFQLPSDEVSRLLSQGMPVNIVTPSVPARADSHAGRKAADDGRRDEQAPVAASASTVSDTLSQVANNVSSAMDALIRSGQVNVRRYDTWVAVDISADILFPSGVAQLSPAAVTVLQRLAETLKPWPNGIRVEGHTDDRPIDTISFPSNWELSAARAASVVRLFMDRGIAANRLAVIGFGQYRPVSSNSTGIGRNANRRVVVVILGKDTAPEGKL